MAEHSRFNIKSLEDLRVLSAGLMLDIPLEEDLGVLFEKTEISGRPVPNRLVIQPMEGFDSTPDGGPGELTRRRYLRYARGGAGMIWFEATSVMQEGRSNPRQLYINRNNVDEFKKLLYEIRKEAANSMGQSHRPFLVLQLTHSGRYSKPEGKNTGKYYNQNPYLDPSGLYKTLISDEEIGDIRQHFIHAVDLAAEAGFDSVDIKISHGYLLHEILASYGKGGSVYGGNYENRTRLIRELVLHPTDLVRTIRLNASDMIPYPYGFGMNKDGSMDPDIDEAISFIKEFAGEVPFWNITAGIPYFNSYVNRPYDSGLKGTPTPPEHPLEGVDRMISLTGKIQEAVPKIPMVGSAYSWLRQWFPNVAAGVIKSGMATYTGIGRLAFAYPDVPKDLREKGMLDRKKVCTSCSNCTQLMRNSKQSGLTGRAREFYKL